MRIVSLPKINTLLLGLIITVNGYVILAPLWPAVAYDWQSHHGTRQRLDREIQPPKTAVKTGSKSSLAIPANEPNHVVIPSMLLDQPILEGPVSQTYKILDKGIWRWPRGSTPDNGGNTVLIGHRFTYTNPRGVFYYLNKVKVGDQIGVFWQGKEYLYKVVSISQVSPNDTAIENNTAASELTLFTCTPLWLPKDRLVVVADLQEVIP